VIGGPIIAIPTTVIADSGRSVIRDYYVLPEELTLESVLDVQEERRKLGAYEVPVYVAKVHMVAQFDIASRIAPAAAGPRAATLHLDQARLLVPVSDPRGVRDVKLSGTGIVVAAFEPERSFPIAGVSISLSSAVGLDGGVRRFEVTLQAAGTESLTFLPTARSRTAQLGGNWLHPGFARGFLPSERKVDGGRFQARWQILDLNRGYASHWFQDEIAEPALLESAYGVDLVQPVDLYQQAERAVKYAELFIALSLLTMFLWEHFARKPLHPIQYGLMGLALSVFCLLLRALAEHIGFALAYVVAALALCALLAIVMVLTRGLDWYQANTGLQADA